MLAAAAAGGFAPPAAAGTPKAVVNLELNGQPAGQVRLDCTGNPTCDLPTVSGYPVWTPTGHTTTTVPAGFSAKELATVAGADPNNVFEMVIDPDPNPPVLGKYLDPANDYPPGQFNPVFYTTGEPGVWFYRQPPTSPTDTNSQYMQTFTGTTTVNFWTVNQVTPTVSVSTKTPKIGQSVIFTASVIGGRSGETFSAYWDITSGGSPGKSFSLTPGQIATTSGVYATAGTYTATLHVSGSEGSAGTAIISGIKVGSKAGNPGPGTHHSHKHKKPVTGSSHKTKTNSNPGTGSGSSSGPPTTNPSTAPPTTTTPPATPHKTTPLPKDPSLPGTPVSGILLSGYTTEVAQPPPPSAAQGPGGTRSPASAPGGLPGAVGGIGLAVLLLLGGFLSEGLPGLRWR